MYASRSFKTKKALKEAVAAGKKIEVFQPAGIGPNPTEGRVCVEGPNYEMHRWYAECTLSGGVIVKVK